MKDIRHDTKVGFFETTGKGFPRYKLMKSRPAKGDIGSKTLNFLSISALPFCLRQVLH